MKRIILSGLALIMLFSVMSQDTTYIDPTFTGESCGTIDNPYTGWRDFKWTSKVYLQKRGTIWEGGTIRPAGENITMGAYGEGKKPIILCTSDGLYSIKAIDTYLSDGITIKNLEICSLYDVTCAISTGNDYNETAIDSCVIHDCKWGIRVFNAPAKITLKNTEIYNTADDGWYSKNVGDVDIYNCYFHDNNDADGGGDCIQIAYEQGELNIYNNVFDHSAHGNKFCFIAGSAYLDRDTIPDDIYFYDNVCIGFQNDTFPTSGIYLKKSIGNLYAYNNDFINCATGIWQDASTTIYNNLFKGCSNGITITSNDTSYISNNVFDNNQVSINAGYGTYARVYNNVFLKGDYTNKYYQEYSDVLFDYNAYSDMCDGCFSNHDNLIDRNEHSGDEINSFIGDFGMGIDYKPIDGSRLIDAGMGIDYRKFDRNKIYAGDKCDIGMYEYVEQKPINSEYQIIISVKVENDSIIINNIKIQ